ncbi:MAG: hypothetical protein AVDCRST_MAG87-356, partial [uncultured Thermomicrobiales bacterium]
EAVAVRGGDGPVPALAVRGQRADGEHALLPRAAAARPDRPRVLQRGDRRAGREPGRLAAAGAAGRGRRGPDGRADPRRGERDDAQPVHRSPPAQEHAPARAGAAGRAGGPGLTGGGGQPLPRRCPGRQQLPELDARSDRPGAGAGDRDQLPVQHRRDADDRRVPAAGGGDRDRADRRKARR